VSCIHKFPSYYFDNDTAGIDANFFSTIYVFGVSTQDVGKMSSDEEEELYQEVESMHQAQEWAIENNIDSELESARMWSSVAMQVVAVEQAFQILYDLLTPPKVRGKQIDPEVPLDAIVRTLVMFGVSVHKIDLDAILDEVQKGMQHLHWAMPEGHYEWKASGIRLSALLSASKSFRRCLIEMEINDALYQFMKSDFSHIFPSNNVKTLLENCKMIKIKSDDVLYNGSTNSLPKYWYFLLEGEVRISREVDEIETESITRREGVAFGASSTLENLLLEHMKHARPGGENRQPERNQFSSQTMRSNSNNASNIEKQNKKALKVKATNNCLVLQMELSRLEGVCRELRNLRNDSSHIISLKSFMIEALATTVTDLSEIKFPDIDGDKVLHKSLQEGSWVEEMHRKKVRDSLAMLENLWQCMSVGANTVPKACLSSLKEVRNCPVFCDFSS
jgi:hypothetical protein